MLLHTARFGLLALFRFILSRLICLKVFPQDINGSSFRFQDWLRSGVAEFLLAIMAAAAADRQHFRDIWYLLCGIRPTGPVDPAGSATGFGLDSFDAADARLWGAGFATLLAPKEVGGLGFVKKTVINDLIRDLHLRTLDSTVSPVGLRNSPQDPASLVHQIKNYLMRPTRVKYAAAEAVYTKAQAALAEVRRKEQDSLRANREHEHRLISIRNARENSRALNFADPAPSILPSRASPMLLTPMVPRSPLAHSSSIRPSINDIEPGVEQRDDLEAREEEPVPVPFSDLPRELPIPEEWQKYENQPIKTTTDTVPKGARIISVGPWTLSSLALKSLAAIKASYSKRYCSILHCSYNPVPIGAP